MCMSLGMPTKYALSKAFYKLAVSSTTVTGRRKAHCLYIYRVFHDFRA